MLRFIQLLFVFLFVLVSMNFFDANFLNESAVNYIVFITIGIAIIFSLPHLLPKQEGFVLPVQLIVLSIFLSIIMAYWAWGQSLKDSIIETTSYLVWIFFFFLLYLKISINAVEKIIVFYGFLYAILYFYQLVNAPTVLFGWAISGDEFTEQRGIVRIIFPGAGIFILSIFLAINKLTTASKGKIIWLTLAILGLVIPVLQVTRQFIAGVFFIYFFHLIRNLSFAKKIILSGAFLGLIFYIQNTDNQIINGLLEVQQRDSQLGKDYIRVLAGEYFLKDFSPTHVNQVLGNGAPSWGISNYGIFIERLAEEKEYFISDVGIIGMYAMFGIFSVIGYILIWIKSITLPLPPNYYYLKYYLWYLLITSLTWYSVYHYSYLIATVFALYLYQIIYKNYKQYTHYKPTDPNKKKPGIKLLTNHQSPSTSSLI
ncbi:MAG TPA: hypothetical protein VGE24_08315 [Emticicia sp.]